MHRESYLDLSTFSSHCGHDLSPINLKTNRLGEPYSECTQDNVGDGEFNFTRNACQKVCLLQHIINNCFCYDYEFKNVNTMLTMLSTLPPCSGKEFHTAYYIRHRRHHRSKDRLISYLSVGAL